MSYLRLTAIGLFLVSLVLEPVSAQARALLLFGYGGRDFPLFDLSSSGDDIGGGAVMGGGVGLQMGAGTALRATFSTTDGDHRGESVSLTDPKIARSFFGADLLFGSPSDAGFAPYIFVGGGRMVVDPADPSFDTVGKWAGKSGLGMNYVPDNSFFVLFVEAAGWVYKFDALGFNRLQVDAALMGGLAFAIPF